jgi:hypothetical protein
MPSSNKIRRRLEAVADQVGVCGTHYGPLRLKEAQPIHVVYPATAPLQTSVNPALPREQELMRLLSIGRRDPLKLSKEALPASLGTNSALRSMTEWYFSIKKLREPQLVAYNSAHGDYNTPQGWAEDPWLGSLLGPSMCCGLCSC